MTRLNRVEKLKIAGKSLIHPIPLIFIVLFVILRIVASQVGDVPGEVYSSYADSRGSLGDKMTMFGAETDAINREYTVKMLSVACIICWGAAGSIVAAVKESKLKKQLQTDSAIQTETV